MSTRSKSAWFAFYVEDYLFGTLTMSLAAQGAYVRLLAYQFDNGMIPGDDRSICRILSAMPEEWHEIKDEVLSKFIRDEETQGFFNKRMRLERAEREQHRQRSIENGRKGGRPKKTGSKNLGVKLKGTQNVTQKEPTGKASTTTPTPTHAPATPSSEVPPKSPKGDLAARESLLPPFKRPTLAEAMATAPQVPCTPECAKAWHADRSSVGWVVVKGGIELPIRNWQADMHKFASYWKNNGGDRRDQNGEARPRL